MWKWESWTHRHATLPCRECQKFFLLIAKIANSSRFQLLLVVEFLDLIDLSSSSDTLLVLKISAVECKKVSIPCVFIVVFRAYHFAIEQFSWFYPS